MAAFNGQLRLKMKYIYPFSLSFKGSLRRVGGGLRSVDGQLQCRHIPGRMVRRGFYLNHVFISQ